MASLIQNNDGSLGIAQPTGGGAGEFTFDARSWGPTSVTSPGFIASRPYQLKSIIARVEAAGTDAAAVTGAVYMAPSGTALGSGTLLHAGTINLKGTAFANQVLTLAATTLIPAGYSVGLVFTGVMTGAAGGVTMAFCPA